MNAIKLTFIGLLSLLILNSCTKEVEGPPGEQGPKGEQGPQGNANVTSGVATITNWIYNSDAIWYQATIIDNRITKDIVDFGLVQVYLVANNGANFALPVTRYPTNTYSQTIFYIYNESQVTIIVQDSDLIQPLNPGEVTVRIVVVNGTAKIANPDTDWTNYNDVKKILKK